MQTALPCRSREGGVLTRPGHTEAAVDLARLAGCQPAGDSITAVSRCCSILLPYVYLAHYGLRHGLLVSPMISKSLQA